MNKEHTQQLARAMVLEQVLAERERQDKRWGDQTFNTDGDEIVHPSLNIIKDCALLSCNVQYTPDGTYMTYDDPFRTMTSYQLTLAFGELDPIFDDDYTDLDDNNDQVIGY